MLGDQAHYFTRFCVTSEPFFTEDEFIIDDDLKTAASRRQHGKRFNIIAKLVEQFCRQTGGAWRVVSLYAIFDTEAMLIHRMLLSAVVAFDRLGTRKVPITIIACRR